MIQREMGNTDMISNSKIVFLNNKDSFSNIFIILNYIILIIFIMFIFNYKFNTYYEVNAIVVKDSKTYLKILIEEDNLYKIQSNYFYYHNKKYIYHIKKIINNNVYNINYKNYMEVYIDSNLGKNILIKNNILTLNIENSKTTLKEIVVNKIKKGIQQ